MFAREQQALLQCCMQLYLPQDIRPLIRRIFACYCNFVPCLYHESMNCSASFHLCGFLPNGAER